MRVSKAIKLSDLSDTWNDKYLGKKKLPAIKIRKEL